MVLKHPILLIATFVLLLVYACPSIALEEQPESIAPSQEKNIPSLSELGTLYVKLTNFVEKSNSRLKLLVDIEEIDSKIEEKRAKVDEMRQKVAALGTPEDWYIDRLTHFKYQFDVARKSLEDIQRELATRLEEVEKIKERQRAEKKFWAVWAESLNQQGDNTLEKTFGQVTAQLATLVASVQKTSAVLVPRQEQVSMVEQVVIEELDRFSRELDRLRTATFRKNDFSFFSSKYYSQFSPSLWEELRAGVRSALVVDIEELERRGWTSLLFLLLVFLLVAGIHKYRARFSKTEEWHFVLNHPWATGSFIASVLVATLSPATSPLFNFVLTLIGVVGATILASALIKNRQQVLLLIAAACVLVISNMLRVIVFPQPLFRLYIAVLALVAIPLLIQQIHLSRKDQTVTKPSFFRSLIRFFVVVLTLSLAGQVGGYVNFSVWLFRAVFETGMIVLYSIMGLRLGNGSIDFILSRESLGDHKFLKKYRQEVSERLNSVLRLVVYFYAFLNLMPIWRIFNGPGEAWEYLAKASIFIGSQQITLQMVVLAAIALFIAVQFSWLLQALCETQVFHRKSVDRGVLDAIKKLIHYGVILVGFLVALSSLGMNLQHFVVILGALGVGIGFGLQDIVNNFLSGIILLFERPVKVGDGILVDGEYGTVKHIGLRSTIVETLDQSELIVPNAQMISQKVTNWTLSTRRVRIVIPVGVAYGSPVPEVLTILTDVSTNHPEVLDSPEPSPIFVSFGDSSLDFELRVWIENIDGRPRVKSELLLQIDSRFREEGIQIPFPQRDLHLRTIDNDILSDMKK